MIATVLAPAHALNLGEIKVHSALGEQLNATVPVQIAQGEYLGTSCVSAPGPADTDLGALRNVRVSAPETAMAGVHEIRLTTVRRLFEPMYELQLQVKCPGTPLVLRQYVLMLDLPGTLPEAAAPPMALAPAPTAPAVDVAPAAEPPRPAAKASAAPPVPSSAPVGSPIQAGSRYRVSAGDTLFGIARRVSDRASLSIWAVADRIFAANPAAFIGTNPDLIRLGAEIDIPGATSTATANGAVEAAATPLPVVPPLAEETTAAATAQVAAAPAAAEASVAPQTDATIAAATAAAPVVTAASETPRARSAPTARRASDTADTSWYLAALAVAAGLALGLVALRRRLVDAIRDLLARRAARGTPVTVASRAGPASISVGSAPAAADARIRVSEPVMVVEEAPVEAPAELTPDTEPTTRTQALSASSRLKPAAGSMDLDAELDQLFADEHSLAFPEALDEADSVGDLDLDLTNALSDAPTEIAPAQHARGAEPPPSRRASDALVTPVEDTAEHLDLQSLATSADGDEKLSQTLMEALTLLERDYEDELTASQVVDLNKLRESVADEDDDTATRTGTGSRGLR